MPEVDISIGGRTFAVACQEGEESYLLSAAKLLDNEASALSDQIGRLSESRLLLMAGLMLADKTSGVQDQLSELQDKLATQDRLIAELRANADAAEDPAAILAPLIEQAEMLADKLEGAA